MLQTHLADLDELVQAVRDLNSREYIAEAIAAYRSRAYRSAIMGTWVAVAYDIISKIRELAVQGDPRAASFASTLDAAIVLKATNYPQAVKKLQMLENDLLDQALNAYEFITTQEHTDLDRLKQDRNQCAHPAFVSDTTLFQPLPEQVRTHIAHAIQHLLCHPPTQGKNALVRLKADLLQPSFPVDQKAVSEFMEMRYLNYAKNSLLENLVTVFLKILIKASEPDLAGKEDSVLRCLVSFAIRRAGIFERKMSEQLPLLTDSSDDNELKRVFRLFAADKRCWAWLSTPTKIKMTGIIRGYNFDSATMDAMTGALEIDELRPLLVSRVASFAAADKEAVLSKYQRPEFIDLAIDLYSKVAHFRDAVRIGRTVILPLANMLDADHVRRLLEAATTNYEIYGVITTSEILQELFERTADLREATKNAWQSFMTKMMQDKNPDDRFAYPVIRGLMESTGIWPI